MSRAKKSARLIGMPPSTFFSRPTEGLVLFCSISEMTALDTPARLASSRCDRPFSSRRLRSLAGRDPARRPQDPHGIMDGWLTAVKYSKQIWNQDCRISRSLQSKLSIFLIMLRMAEPPTPPTKGGPAMDGSKSATVDFDAAPNNLEAFWMPFTWNRRFKQHPLLLASAKDMHYTTRRRPPDPRRHRRALVLQRRPPPRAHRRGGAADRRAPRLRADLPARPSPALRAGRAGDPLVPGDYDHVFFCNSGSEAVDSALKIALAYHRVRGDGARTRLIGRERGYHGVGFGGISVGGIVKNRMFFGPLINGVDHLPHTRACRAQRLHPRPAGVGRAPGRRAGAHRRPARRLAPSPPSSSSRSPDRPACWCRQRAIWSACARSATSTASC